MKLLNYRVNGKPSEKLEDLNADWVHSFYKWLKHTGQNKDVHKLSHNPFTTDPKYLIDKNTHREDHALNTFGQHIHKQMLKYLEVLNAKEFIPDFSKQIDASAFVKTKHNPKGLLSIYDDNVEFLEPNEFLELMYADVSKIAPAVLRDTKAGKQRLNKQILSNTKPKDREKLYKEFTKKSVKELEETRDAFILQILLGGLRVSDLIKEKKITTLNSFSLVQFKQKKTGGLVRNIILEPALLILKKYDNTIPVDNDVIFNQDLKDLFCYLGIKRNIGWMEYTMNGVRNLNDEIANIISSKYARGTYYVLAGAMGETIDNVMKRTGYTDKAVVLKHYFGIGQNYSESDLLELLEIFKS